jgi:hypothetical protein
MEKRLVAKAPSEKTQLIAARRQIKQLEYELSGSRLDCTKYRARATTAEKEVAEWKARFDELLKLRVDVKHPSASGDSK